MRSSGFKEADNFIATLVSAKSSVPSVLVSRFAARSSASRFAARSLASRFAARSLDSRFVGRSPASRFAIARLCVRRHQQLDLVFAVLLPLVLVFKFVAASFIPALWA